MNTTTARKHEWTDYYKQFDYFKPEDVRDGCQPRIRLHNNPSEKAIVLVHGLSDSPYYVSEIGDFFFETLGYDVYMPLLHCHGLKNPEGMSLVDLEEWKSNVGYAIDQASQRSEQVSVGGLSTGGTLSFYMAGTNAKVTGSLYLFSAALDLSGGLLGEVKERMLRTFMADLLDRDKPLIGPNPFKYSHVDMDGAQELAKLILETDQITKQIDEAHPFPVKVFAAHSEKDSTANITGIEQLLKVVQLNQLQFFRIAANHNVAHAGLVLKEPIVNGEYRVEANPLFDKMMDSVRTFEVRNNAMFRE